jgi:hypothetical protein
MMKNRVTSVFGAMLVLSGITVCSSPGAEESGTLTPMQHGGFLADWVSLSANGGYEYHSTKFAVDGLDSFSASGDLRLELWLPPHRGKFAFGPYLRLSGIRNEYGDNIWIGQNDAGQDEWLVENAWLALPGFGVQAYPFSLFQDEPGWLYEMAGPLRLFFEYNELEYWGAENSTGWRPDTQTRYGLEYWKAYGVNDLDAPWWTEIWSGLICSSANEFSPESTLNFGLAARAGVRKAGDRFLGLFSPYLAVENALSDNTYSWENRLLMGGGIRITPNLGDSSDKVTGLSRLVFFVEAMGVVAEYEDKADSEAPDWDIRAGISISLGQWYR